MIGWHLPVTAAHRHPGVGEDLFAMVPIGPIVSLAGLICRKILGEILGKILGKILGEILRKILLTRRR